LLLQLTLAAQMSMATAAIEIFALSGETEFLPRLESF